MFTMKTEEIQVMIVNNEFNKCYQFNFQKASD